MADLIPFDQSVFIGYHDADMKEERMRAYPCDEESFYECMDDMNECCDYWQLCDRRKIDQEQEWTTPYQRWQMEKYGNVVEASTGNDTSSRQDEFNRWFANQSELQEMHAQGY